MTVRIKDQDGIYKFQSVKEIISELEQAVKEFKIIDTVIETTEMPVLHHLQQKVKLLESELFKAKTYNSNLMNQQETLRTLVYKVEECIDEDSVTWMDYASEVCLENINLKKRITELEIELKKSKGEII